MVTLDNLRQSIRHYYEWRRYRTCRFRRTDRIGTKLITFGILIDEKRNEIKGAYTIRYNYYYYHARAPAQNRFVVKRQVTKKNEKIAGR